MADAQKLFLIRTLHTIIYIIMASATVFVVVSAVTGYSGVILFVALGLVGIESVVFFTNGMKCPLTGLAKKYGADKGYAFDTFLPEALTKYTFRFFTSLFVFGLILLAARIVSQ